jgi:hypothetical protein
LGHVKAVSLVHYIYEVRQVTMKISNRFTGAGLAVMLAFGLLLSLRSQGQGLRWCPWESNS